MTEAEKGQGVELEVWNRQAFDAEWRGRTVPERLMVKTSFEQLRGRFVSSSISALRLGHFFASSP
jgi:hypothetical protein